MGSEQLSPNSTAYLTSLNRYQNFIQKSANISIDTDNFTFEVNPKASAFGDGQIFLSGQATVSGTPSTDYSIGTLPAKYIPLKDYILPIAVMRAGAYVSNGLRVNAGGNSIDTVTVTTPGSYATKPTTSIVGPGAGAVLVTHMKAISATIAAAGTGYVPTNTITTTGSTGTNPILTVASTKVVSATVASGGTGGTPGTQTVTGTTGTGTKFQASVTVSGGGAITAVGSITVAGAYTVNPTSIAAEPVTGAGLTGATLTVVMGVNAVTVSTPGDCTVLASSPVAQGSTSGAGTGATFTVLWGVLSIVVTSGGTDYTRSSLIEFTGGGSTGGAAATINLDTGGQLELINAPTSGDIVVLDGANFFVQAYN